MEHPKCVHCGKDIGGHRAMMCLIDGQTGTTYFERDRGHEMQHSDSPTWCIMCGIFDQHAKNYPCVEDRSGKYDASKPDARERFMNAVFGDGWNTREKSCTR